jgi:NADPH:quinone reductase-like Zn-dependent oxidoreductase
MTHAILEREFGGPDVLKYEETGLPQLKAGEALVDVHAAGVNPVDIAVREGEMGDMIRTPMVPGCDIAGKISRVGTGVTNFKPGDEVYGMIGFTGGYTEEAVAKTAYLAPKPRILDFAHAAAVPLTSLAAWQSLFDLGHLTAGQRILIHGAAGGVGSFAVQFAHNAGAYVIGTAAAPDIDYVRSLGADETIDYRAQRFEDVAHDVDFVFDVIGGETQERSWSVLKQGGTLVTTRGLSNPLKAREKNAVAKELFVHPDGNQLRHIGGLIDVGKVKVIVTGAYPLQNAAKAQEDLRTSHTRGKLVLVAR